MTVASSNSEPLGIESTLWEAADKLRGSVDAAEYKHVVLGLVFLKYVSDTYEAHRDFLERATSNPEDEYYVDDPEQRQTVIDDRDEYIAENVFWVPPDARWSEIRDKAKQPDIGQTIDKAMDLIEKQNWSLTGILPKNYARPELDVRRLGELVDTIGSITFEDAHKGRDLLGRVYEYFLGKFAAAEGKGAGEFYTPTHLVRLLVEMLEPYEGRVCDPCCGAGGMFVQSAKFIEAHGGNPDRISIYGQELTATTWRLARMNLAIHGLDGDLGDKWGDTFHANQHPDLKADFVLANPPFNISDWGGQRLREDRRWVFGTPPDGNANYAWLQHIYHHLAPGGTAGVVLANGSMSTQTLAEAEIRKRMIQSDVVDCMVALPGQLFYSTQIPVCLWFLARDRSNGKHRDRRGEVLFIDARKLGTMVDRTHRDLTAADIQKISDTYHAWRDGSGYEDIAGFCKAAVTKEITEHGFILTPGRYVGAEDVDDDGESVEDKMARLTAVLSDQFKRSAELTNEIREQLAKVGYEV